MRPVFTKQSIIDQTGFDMESLSSDIADLLIDGLNKSIAPLIEENERLRTTLEKAGERLVKACYCGHENFRKRPSCVACDGAKEIDAVLGEKCPG